MIVVDLDDQLSRESDRKIQKKKRKRKESDDACLLAYLPHIVNESKQMV